MKKKMFSLLIAMISLFMVFSVSADTSIVSEGSVVNVFPEALNRKKTQNSDRTIQKSPENTRDYLYFQDFESTPEYQLPTDWTGVIASEYPGANVRVTGYPAYESQRSLQIGAHNYIPDYIHEIYAITQELDNISSKRIRFMCKGYRDNSELHIGTTEANSGFVNFVTAETITVDYQWTEYLITFENVPTTSNYIAFKYYDSHSDIYIDNVLIEDVPTTPLLAVNTNHIDFGDVPHNRGVRSQLLVSNIGTLPLSAEFISLNYEYDFSPQQVMIEPEMSIPITVVLDAHSATSSVGEYLGSFTILTNYPTQDDITITTSANILPSLSENTTIIGTGSEDGSNMFLRHNFPCSYSQTIYYAEEISIANQRIEQISVFSNGDNVIGPVDIVIYLAHTDRTEFSNDSDWLDASELTEVFNGTIERTSQSGWIDISLDVPYEYDNRQNLLVAVDKNGPSTYHGYYSVFYNTVSEFTRSILAVDNNNIDPASPPESEFIFDAFIYDGFTNIKFDFGSIPDTAELAFYPVNNDYAFVEIDNSPLEKTIRMKSIGLQAITINEAPVITGPNSTEFVVTSDLNNYPLTLLPGEIAEFNVSFQPSSRWFKNAQISLNNNSDNMIHEVSLTGYGYEVDNNNIFSNATVLNLPTEGDMYEIYPINDDDWYLLQSLGVNDTLFVSYENVEGHALSLGFYIYNLSNPPTQPLTSGIEIEFVIPQSGDYLLEVVGGSSSGCERTGVYQLFVKADYNFQYFSPVNVEASNQAGYVEITWDEPPFQTSISGYKLYRNGYLITNDLMPLGTTSYSDFNVQLGTEYEYYLKAFYDNPIGFSLPSNTASIAYYSAGQPLWGDDFENYSDFAIDLPNWIVYDLDASPTYSLDNFDFEHEGSPMSFIVFNPSATSPPMEGLLPYGGDKFLASFASLEGQNNDWIISQTVSQGPISTVSFFAKSYSPESGLERFKVRMSLGGNNIEDFIYSLHPYIEYLEAPPEWTLFSFNTSPLVNHPLRYAIQCVSTNGTIFMVDDFRIDSLEGTVDNETVDEIPHLNILSQNYPNPFNPETSIAFITKEAGNVIIEIYNLKGQKVKTLLNEHRDAGQHSLVWNGKDENKRQVATGIYFYRMKSGSFSSTKKMVLMK